MKATSVFKWLLITFIVITIPFLCIEYINVATSAPLLKNHIRKSLQAACDYYSAETYLSSNNSRYNLPNISNPETGGFVSGSFYGNLSKNSIYSKIMRSFDRDVAYGTLPYYSNSANRPSSYTKARLYFESLKDYVERTHTKFSNKKVTPVNMGITHIDKDITLKMFKYNLASTLIGGNKANLIKVNGKTVVRFNGFEVDIDSITINVQHVITSKGSQYYSLATGLDNSKLGNNRGSYNSNVIVAEVSYKVPVRYKGITPMEKAVEWIWNNDVRVHGTKSTTPTYNQLRVNMDNFGTIDSNNSDINLIDKIYYTIID